MATQERSPPFGKLIVSAVLIIVALSFVLGAVVTIPAGHRGVLLTFGKVEPNILGEGMSFVTPYVNSVVPMSVQTQKYSAKASSASKDLQIVSTEVTLNYRVDVNKVNQIYQNVGVHFEDTVIQPAIQEVTKASTAIFTAEELITERPVVKQKIEESLKERIVGYGIVVESVSITDFNFSPEFNTAIEQKVVALQLSMKAENDLKRIQIEAQQAITVAEGQATATLTKAKAEAEAIKITADALKQNPQLISLEWVKKFDGKLPNTLIIGGCNDMPSLILPVSPVNPMGNI